MLHLHFPEFIDYGLNVCE